MKKMNKQPKVSIVIPVYNGANYMREAIDSALAQTYKNIEIIVVNDGSTDDGATREIALSYGERINYYEKENGGVSTALNYGISVATGEYLSWLSHDDLYFPHKVEKQMSIYKILDNPQTIIFSNCELIGGEGNVFNKTNHTAIYTKEELCMGIFPVIRGAVNGCSVMIHKKCFDEIGLFKEELKTSQDYDMWFRLFEKYPSYFMEDCLIQYRIHQQQDTKRHPRRYEESQKLWDKVLTKLTIEDIVKMKKDPMVLLLDLYFWLSFSEYKEAEKVASRKIKEYYEKVSKKKTNLIETLETADYKKMHKKEVVKLQEEYYLFLNDCKNIFAWDDEVKNNLVCSFEWFIDAKRRASKKQNNMKKVNRIITYPFRKIYSLVVPNEKN